MKLPLPPATNPCIEIGRTPFFILSFRNGDSVGISYSHVPEIRFTIDAGIFIDRGSTQYIISGTGLESIFHELCAANVKHITARDPLLNKQTDTWVELISIVAQGDKN